mmetsp:Transcript_3351/g.8937  ORF Transcript_3351/g.8937 Transcript_3351/m.8937 type:complete len:556 (-) Transcript_3351:1579-3246(-)
MSSLSSQIEVLTDEPKWSSSSLCITLNHLGKEFRPEYTHQVAVGECWRGYRPRESVLRRANAEFTGSSNKGDEFDSSPALDSSIILHKSHQNHETTANELDIRVTLSPSCQKCCVEILRLEGKSGRQDAIDKVEREAKRRRTDVASDSLQRNNASPKGTAERTDGQESKNKTPLSESISLLPMKDSEILSDLSKALPPIASLNDTSSSVEDCFLSEPVGDVLEAYSILATGNAGENHLKPQTVDNDARRSSKNFVITIADGRLPCVSEYHRSVQNLSLFYIENADTVDVGNDGSGGFWKILYIFQVHDEGVEKEKKNVKYSLVGYFTLFHFIALFHKPDPGVIPRICQALILPPYQGQGHGGRLLQAIHNLAHNNCEQTSVSEGDDQHRNIIQVNVEDPAPAFVALRNKVDLKLVLRNYKDWNWPEKGSMWNLDRPNCLASNDKISLFFSTMIEKEASEISVKAKITQKQIHIVNELLKLKAIRSSVGKNGNDVSSKDSDTIERYYRLMVKRRLNKEHRDVLLEQPTKDDQKILLGKLFDEELKGYERILDRLPA